MTTYASHINLDHVEIIDSSTLETGEIVLKVKSTEEGTCCKRCGQRITAYHSLNKTIRLNHLPAFGTTVYIDFQPIRYQCLDCEGFPTTTQKPSWYQSRGHCTTAYAQHILKLLVNSTIEDVAA
jgi:transposase